jgi:hypothetical protein
MENIYLQIDFNNGKFYQFSSFNKEGFAEYTSMLGKKYYKKYYDGKVIGTYLGLNFINTPFGKNVILIFKEGYRLRLNSVSHIKYLNNIIYNMKEGEKYRVAYYKNTFNNKNEIRIDEL